MKCSPRGNVPFLIKVFLLLLIFTMILLLVFQFSYSTKIIPQRELKPDMTILSKIYKKAHLVHTYPQTTEGMLIEDMLIEDMYIENIQERMPNLPILYWNKNKNKLSGMCAKFPDLFDIEYNNEYWQIFSTTSETFHLFGAYLDVRKNNQFGSTVRILGMMDSSNPTITTHCQLWFNNESEPVIVKTYAYEYIWRREWEHYRQGIYQPYLITCNIPQEYRTISPVSVSLVENPCDNATNNLKVIYNKREEKKDFAVCVKGLSFPLVDITVRLVEWIELLNLLGADKVFLYELEVHPNVSKLLDYYQKQGKVHVTPLKLPGVQPNGPILQSFYLKKYYTNKNQNELIPYNDCFYKHMYEYKYIVLVDTDEIIMPVGCNSWKELIDKVSKEAWMEKPVERVSFNVRNVYFLDDLLHEHDFFKGIPPYMHMLLHVYRSKNYTKPGYTIKSFHNTEKVLTLHNHYHRACLGNCYSYPINTSDAQLQHYRSGCVKELGNSCANFRNNSIIDTSIWKFKEPLTERVVSVLRTLGYISNIK